VGLITFRVNTQPNDRVQVVLYDVSGETLSTLTGIAINTSLDLVWDTIEFGPGVYLARVKVNDKSTKLKIAVVK
jgi:hypothetical protein